MSSFEYLFGNVDETGHLENDNLDDELRQSLQQNGDYLSRILEGEFKALTDDQSNLTSGNNDGSGAVKHNKDAIDFSNIEDDIEGLDSSKIVDTPMRPLNLKSHLEIRSESNAFFGALSKDKEGNIDSSVFTDKRKKKSYSFTEHELESRFPGYKKGKVKFSHLYLKPSNKNDKNYFYSHFQLMTASNQFSTAALEKSSDPWSYESIINSEENKPETPSTKVIEEKRAPIPLLSMDKSKRLTYLSKRASTIDVRYQPYIYPRDDMSAFKNSDIPLISIASNESQGKFLIELIKNLKTLNSHLTSSTNNNTNDQVYSDDDFDRELDPDTDLEGEIDTDDDMLDAISIIDSKLQTIDPIDSTDDDYLSDKENIKRLKKNQDSMQDIEEDDEEIEVNENSEEEKHDKESKEIEKEIYSTSIKKLGASKFFQLANVKSSTISAKTDINVNKCENDDLIYDKYSPYILPMSIEESKIMKKHANTLDVHSIKPPSTEIIIADTPNNATNSINVNESKSNDTAEASESKTNSKDILEDSKLDTDSENTIRTGSKRFAEHMRPMKLPKWYSNTVKIDENNNNSNLEVELVDYDESKAIYEKSSSEFKNSKVPFIIPRNISNLLTVHFDDWDDKINWDGNDEIVKEATVPGKLSENVPEGIDNASKKNNNLSIITSKDANVPDDMDVDADLISHNELKSINKDLIILNQSINNKNNVEDTSNTDKSKVNKIVDKFSTRDVRFDLVHWEKSILWDDEDNSNRKVNEDSNSTRKANHLLMKNQNSKRKRNNIENRSKQISNGAYGSDEDDSENLLSLIDWEYFKSKVDDFTSSMESNINLIDEEINKQTFDGFSEEEKLNIKKQKSLDEYKFKKQEFIKKLFSEMLSTSSRELILKYFEILDGLYESTNNSLIVGKQTVINDDGEEIKNKFNAFGEPIYKNDEDDDDDEDDQEESLLFGEAIESRKKRQLQRKINEFWNTYFDSDSNPIKLPDNHELKSRYRKPTRLFNLAPIEINQLPTFKDSTGNTINYINSILNKIGNSSNTISEFSGKLSTNGNIQGGTALEKYALELEKTNSKHAILFAQPLLTKFFLSQDKTYEKAAKTKNDKVRQMYGPTTLVHAPSAAKLHPLLFKTCYTKHELRFLHRPNLRITRSMFNQENYCTSIRGKKKQKKASSKEISEKIKSVKDISLRDGSDYILVEYSEERPPILMNNGMGSILYNYYRKRNENDDYVPELTHGGPYLLETTDSSPFSGFGELAPGETFQALQNNMMKAPLFRHETHPTDFLCVRQSLPNGELKYMLRTINASYVSGQTLPTMEVPMPQSRRIPITTRARIQSLIIRLSRKDSRKWFEYKKLLRLYSAIPEHQFKARLKEVAVLAKKVGSSVYWKMKPHLKQQSEEELRESITPEMWCTYEGMLQTQQYFKDLTIGDLLLPEELFQIQKRFFMNAELKDLEENIASWHLTKNFIVAANGRGFVQIYGHGDNSGSGRYLACSKALMKEKSFLTSIEYLQIKRNWYRDNNLEYEYDSDEEYLRGNIPKNSRYYKYKTIELDKLPILHSNCNYNENGVKFTQAEQQAVFKDEVNRVWLLQKRALTRVDLAPPRSSTGILITKDENKQHLAILDSVDRYKKLQLGKNIKDSNENGDNDEDNINQNSSNDSKFREVNEDDDHDENLDIDLKHELLTDEKARLRYQRRNEAKNDINSSFFKVDVDNEEDERIIPSNNNSNNNNNNNNNGNSNDQNNVNNIDDDIEETNKERNISKKNQDKIEKQSYTTEEMIKEDDFYHTRNENGISMINNVNTPRKILSIHRHYKNKPVKTEIVNDPRVISAYLKQKAKLEAQRRHIAEIKAENERKRRLERMRSENSEESFEMQDANPSHANNDDLDEEDQMNV